MLFLKLNQKYSFQPIQTEIFEKRTESKQKQQITLHTPNIDSWTFNIEYQLLTV